MEIFWYILVYAVIGIWFVYREPKGGVKSWQVSLGYTLFLPILLVHLAILLVKQQWGKRQP